MPSTFKHNIRKIFFGLGSQIGSPTQKKYFAISSGIIVFCFWIILFTIGLVINSTNYRAAVSYGYADFVDWVLAIISFTLSNVILLAFLAGFLGGTCSKIISTEGFTLSQETLVERGVDYVLYENPFISAFRGIFLFLAILALQYVSSFSDLGSISASAVSKQTSEYTSDNQVYTALLENVSDSICREKIIAVWKNEKKKDIQLSDQDSLINQVFLYKDSIKEYKDSIKDYKDSIKQNKGSIKRLGPVNLKEKQEQEQEFIREEKIRSLREAVKVPPLSDIPGMSSSSYFKFAIIISLLAFICGYDPRLFSTFLSNLPFINKKSTEKKE
jgi:hypothetical protein